MQKNEQCYEFRIDYVYMILVTFCNFCIFLILMLFFLFCAYILDKWYFIYVHNVTFCYFQMIFISNDDKLEE